jgi:hypothetical protein
MIDNIDGGCAKRWRSRRAVAVSDDDNERRREREKGRKRSQKLKALIPCLSNDIYILVVSMSFKELIYNYFLVYRT